MAKLKTRFIPKVQMTSKIWDNSLFLFLKLVVDDTLFGFRRLIKMDLKIFMQSDK